MEPAKLLWGFDFYAFWASGRVRLAGGNPYEINALLPVTQAAGWPAAMEGHTFTPYPPWAQLLFLPFALLPFHLANILWFILNLVVISHSALILDKYLSERFNVPRLGPVSLACATLLFPPTFRELILGQTAFINLYACCLALLLLPRLPIIAGMALSLTLIKFQIFLPIYAAIAGASVVRGQFRFLIGLLIGCGCIMGITFLSNPSSMGEYRHFLQSNYAFLHDVPVQTFTAFLHRYLGVDHLRVTIMGAACALFLGIGAMLKVSFENILLFGVPLALVVSPYCWLHDSLPALVAFLLLYHVTWGRRLCWVLGMVALFLHMKIMPEMLTSVLPLIIAGALLVLVSTMRDRNRKSVGI